MLILEIIDLIDSDQATFLIVKREFKRIWKFTNIKQITTVYVEVLLSASLDK